MLSASSSNPGCAKALTTWTTSASPQLSWARTRRVQSHHGAASGGSNLCSVASSLLLDMAMPLTGLGRTYLFPSSLHFHDLTLQSWFRTHVCSCRMLRWVCSCYLPAEAGTGHGTYFFIARGSWFRVKQGEQSHSFHPASALSVPFKL